MLSEKNQITAKQQEGGRWFKWRERNETTRGVRMNHISVT